MDETLIPQVEADDETDPAYDEDLPTATLTTAADAAVRATFLGGAVEAAQVITAIARGETVVQLDNGKIVNFADKLQFDAAKYVVEYALGKPKEDGATDQIDALLEKFGKDESAAEKFVQGGKAE